MSNSWYIQNGRLTNNELPNPLGGGYFMPPYPNNFWYVEDSRLTNGGLPAPLDGGYFTPPYPNGWWYVENGRLLNSALPEPTTLGCFAGCSNLKKVTIPRSVSKIWSDAFIGTKLKTVTIGKNCTYDSTSFPPDILINHYDA